MLTVINNTNIEYTAGDTFNMPVTATSEGEFSAGMQLRFIVAQNTQSEYLIDNTYDINEDLVFNVILSENDIKKVPLGEYIYKIIIFKNNEIRTEKSGFFTVKWGA
jgi:hypothetical protein